jgi:hypothetical protein
LRCGALFRGHRTNPNRLMHIELGRTYAKMNRTDEAS